MFNAISWGQYAGWLFLALVIYYAYVGVAYYRVELLGLLKNKGKAAGSIQAPDLVPATPRSTGKKSLIAKAALAVPVTPLEVTEPTALNEEGQFAEEAVGEGAPAEISHQQGEQSTNEQLEPVADLPALELPSVEQNGVSIYENYDEFAFVNDNSINFTEHDGSDSFQDTESGMESVSNDFYVGSTIGIAQLGDYLGRATEGQVTPEQLAEQEPALANTDLLLAFFQNSTKNAQRATAHLYEGVAEPVLD